MKLCVFISCGLFLLAFGSGQADEKRALRKPAVVKETGPTTVKMYFVPDGKAEKLAKTLKELFQDVKVSTLGANQILVRGNAAVQREIAEVIATLEQSAPPPASVVVLPLTNLKADRVTNTLKAMFRSTDLFLEADRERNAIVVRGTQPQIADIRAALRAMGEGPEAGSNVAVFNLERASATLVAEALAEMLPRLRANPLRVVLPGQMAKPPAKKAPADAKPITLTPAGKRLVVACDDPQALVLIRELVDKLTSPEARDFEIIRLRHGRAAEVARSLDQLLNDQRAGSEPDGKHGDTVKKVRIVVDSVTNSLLVKAAPLDQFLIRKLIVNALDTSEPPDASTIRIRLFPLKFAQAPELVKVLRETYRDASKTAVFSADPRSNTLIVRCPPHMDAEITLLVGKLDVEANGK